jgi:predicted phosphodiesterase
MSNKIESIKEDIIEIYKNGGIKADAARFISKKIGLGRTQSQEWARRIYDECRVFGSAEEDNTDTEKESVISEEKESDLEFSDQYVYNKEDDTYIFLLDKRFGKNIKVKGEQIRALIDNYSNYDDNPDTLNQVAIKYSIPRKYLIHILKILAITHDSLPITPEEYVEEDVDDLKERLITGKKFTLSQKLQKEDWKETKNAARKWNEFAYGKLNPFETALETWNPKPLEGVSGRFDNAEYEYDENKVFLCVLTDTHIGELTKNSWEGKTFNTEKAVQNIISYIMQIDQKLSEKKYFPSKCKLVIMGDILNSFVDGMTRRGTQVSNDIINAELYKVGLDTIIAFVDAMRQIFKTVDISCVKGNHDSDLIWAVYYAASRFFETNDQITWKISDYWLDSFKINQCYFIYTHGKDDVNHIALPKSNSKKFESFVQSLLLSKVKELVDVESKYFISGHLHSYEQIELNDFEFIQVPASVSADEFAEGLGFRSKARQNCFVVGQKNIEEILHFYFE